MSQLAQAADHLEQMALDATLLPWEVLHHGSRTGASWISVPGKVVGKASADDADLVLAAVNSLPALVILLRVIEKDVGTSSLAYKAAEEVAKKILGQD